MPFYCQRFVVCSGVTGSVLQLLVRSVGRSYGRKAENFIESLYSFVRRLTFVGVQYNILYIIYICIYVCSCVLSALFFTVTSMCRQLPAQPFSRALNFLVQALLAIHSYGQQAKMVMMMMMLLLLYCCFCYC